MGFSCQFKTLRSGNSYNLRIQSKVLTHGDENTGEMETGMIEGSEENSIRFSPELVVERIKASLEPLDAQISALAEMMDRLIQSNSAKESTTASSRGTRHQFESPYSGVPGFSRFPTVAALTTARYSPDTQWSTWLTETPYVAKFERSSIERQKKFRFQKCVEIWEGGLKVIFENLLFFLHQIQDVNGTLLPSTFFDWP